MVPFSVQNLPFSEPMLTVWAKLVNLAGSKLEKQRMKKSLSRGLTGTCSSHQMLFSCDLILLILGFRTLP